MSKEYRAKVFKSGNSLALRLPKALGLSEGAEMRVREESGKFVVEPADLTRKISGEGWMGMVPDAEPRREEDRAFDPSPRPWDAPDWNGWTNPA